MKTASQTNADGEYAAEKSRNMKASERLDAQALLSIANTRYTGSTIMNATNHVKSQYPKLHTSSEQWNIAKKTAKSTHYKTYSHYDSGPKEFQVAETTYELGKDIEKSINEMLNAIQLTQDKVPLLNQKIQEFINKGYVHHATSEKEAKALGKEILSITKEIYKANFKQGVNVERFRWGMIFLFALIGGIIGAGFGF
ncbi:MAG: hypothetical protein LBD11_03090 [Candidatus Peribacteria bacterium]|jgi:hypothetical protein|nr:hypothetical protein [Candidatus Peribacteria bacterium]